MQKEYLTAGGRVFECTQVITGIDSITARTASGSADAMREFFLGVDEASMSFEEGGVPHGTFKNLKFAGASINAPGEVTVEMHIMSQQEIDMAELKESQAEQDEVIAEMKYGR